MSCRSCCHDNENQESSLFWSHCENCGTPFSEEGPRQRQEDIRFFVVDGVRWDADINDEDEETGEVVWCTDQPNRTATNVVHTGMVRHLEDGDILRALTWSIRAAEEGNRLWRMS